MQNDTIGRRLLRVEAIQVLLYLLIGGRPPLKGKCLLWVDARMGADESLTEMSLFHWGLTPIKSCKY